MYRKEVVTMRIPIFLSKPSPICEEQECFIDCLIEFLKSEGLEPRTLGVTDYDINAPLKGIRRIMMESNGLLAIALKKTHIETGCQYKEGCWDCVEDKWLTSPYCQIEPAMAFQLGLPVLILRDKSVIADGILEKGALGSFMSVFDMKDGCDYFGSDEFLELLREWEADVRTVAKNKGNPPRLY